MIKNIEISEQAARDMLPCLESKMERLQEMIEGYGQEYASLKTTVAELRAKLEGGELPLHSNGKLPGRLPKGQGEKLILSLLESLPLEQGLTMAEIAQKTGVKQTTVYRTLSEPKRNQGRFTSVGNKWRVTQK